MMTPINRRRFLVYATSGAATLAAGGLTAAGLLYTPGMVTVKRKSHALGTSVTITAVHRDRNVAEKALSAAFDELETVEQVMSIYRPESQLSQLNRNGAISAPHPYLVEVLTAAARISQQSAGAFDVTVQPLWAEYHQARRTGGLPSAANIAAAGKKVNWRQVKVSPSQIKLTGDGAAITLNGIAQGFAADRAASALQRHGVAHALVDTGEISPTGSNAAGSAWQAGIQHPRQADAFVSLAQLDGRCLATSGDYASTFTADFKHHHLLDPRTGDSPQSLSSVTIAASTAMEADALSTAVFILGPEAGAELVASVPKADALFVLKNGRTLTTGGFPIV